MSSLPLDSSVSIRDTSSLSPVTVAEIMNQLDPRIKRELADNHIELKPIYRPAKEVAEMIVSLLQN